MKKMVLGLVAALAAASASAGWTYDSSAKTMTDGNWTLKVSGLDASKGIVSIGVDDTGLKSGYVAGSGVLDLRGTLFTIDTVAYDKKEIKSGLLRTSTAITEFYADGLTDVGGTAFYKCTSLTTVAIGGTFTSLPSKGGYGGQGLFHSCSKLASFTMDAPNLVSIGGDAFNSAANLVADIEDICPSTLKTIGNKAFFMCGKLTGHLKLYGVESLGKQAFAKCAGIAEVTIVSDALTEIPTNIDNGQGLFTGTSLTNVTMRCPNLTSVGAFAFHCLTSMKGDISQLCPPTVETIGTGAFYWCAGVSGDLYLPKVKSIGQYAFGRSVDLKSIYLDGDITSLPEFDSSYKQAVFSGIAATNIVIAAKGFETIGNGAFMNAGAMTSIRFASTNAITVATGAVNRSFATARNLKEIRIEGLAWSQESVDEILLAITAVDGAKACTIYVDPEKGWGDLLATDYTENERANKPRKCLGVYVTAGGDRKVWVVNGVVRTGTKLIFR